MLRIDDAHRVLGLRLNVWTSLLVFALGVLVFVVAGRLGRPTRVVADRSSDEAAPSAGEDDSQASAEKGDTDTSSTGVAEGSSDDSEPDRS
jgi:prolipoprotein diacylglyceryl transferase 1